MDAVNMVPIPTSPFLQSLNLNKIITLSYKEDEFSEGVKSVDTM